MAQSLLYSGSKGERKMENKDWYVERDCHLGSGHCLKCQGERKPRRVVQIDKLTESRAKKIAENWREYHGEAKQS